MGNEIENVHPFKFLSTVVCDALLKTKARHIFFESDIALKKSTFLGGIKKGMETHANSGDIGPYIQDFALELKIRPEAVREIIQKCLKNGDWEPFVQHILQ